VGVVIEDDGMTSEEELRQEIERQKEIFLEQREGKKLKGL